MVKSGLGLKLGLGLGLLPFLAWPALGVIREWRVSEPAAGDEESAQIAALANGRLIGTWETQIGPSSQIWFRLLNPLDPLDPAVHPPQPVHPDPSAYQTSPCVAALDGGGFVIAFSGGSNILFQIYNAGGQPQLPTARAANADPNWDHFHPAVASLGSMGFVVAFSRLGPQGQDVYHRRFDPAGNPLDAMEVSAHGLGDDPLIAGDQAHPDVSAWPDGRFVLVLEDRFTERVYGVLFQANGMPQPVPSAPAIRYHFALDEETPPAHRAVWAPKVSAHPDGGFMTAYNCEIRSPVRRRRVCARRFSNVGVAGPEWVLGDVERRCQDPDVQVDSDQAVVFTWQEFDSTMPAPVWTSRAQVILASGSSIGSAFGWGADNLWSRRACRVTDRPGGGFVAVWQSGGQDGDGWGVYARLLAPFDGPPGQLSVQQLPGAVPAEVLVRFTGHPWECYDLQWTEDFESWNSLVKTNPPAGRFEVQQTAAPGASLRLYRVERLFSP